MTKERPASAGQIARARTRIADVVGAGQLVRGIASTAWSAITGKPSVNTTAPLTGGGSLASSLTLAVSTMTGDSGSGGARGVVPAPAAGDAAAGKFLKADGTWTVPTASVADGDKGDITVSGSGATWLLDSTIAGTAGGRTIYGGNAANDDLHLYSTSHATVGYVYVHDDLVIGDAGAEAGGVSINGTNYEAICGVHDIGGTRAASLHLHRHSTTLQNYLLATRSATEDDTHAALASGDVILTMMGAACTGTHYDQSASIEFLVGAGTVTGTSSPGRIRLRTTPDGSQTPTTRVDILANGQVNVTNGLDVGGTLTAQTGDASTPGLLKLGASGGALPYTTTPQTISSATGTITDGTEIVRVTHAAVTALTLPALANTTRQLTITGPAAVAGVDPTCVFARAGSDVIDSGATGFKIQGSNWVVVLESDGAAWRLVSQRGTVQLPVGYVDLTGVSGSPPFTRTDSVNGETVTVTNTSTGGSISAASGVQVTTPAGASAVYASSTGAGFYTDVLAKAGIDVVRDEYAVLVKLSETSTPAASDADAVFLGTTIAASTKLGMGYTETGGVVSVRYGTTSYTVATTATGHDAKGIWYDGRSRSWEALEGAWSGTAQSTLWPLSYARPGGVEKHAMDTAATSAPLDMALATRLVVAASTGAGGARNWLAEYLYVVRILRG